VKWHRELRQLVADAGLGCTIEHGGKHLRVALSNGRIITAACTPSDANAIHRVRRDLQRATTPTRRQALIVAPAIAPIVPVVPTAITASPGPEILYHFTTSGTLWSIIEDGELQPGNDRLLWAKIRMVIAARRATALLNSIGGHIPDQSHRAVRLRRGARRDSRNSVAKIRRCCCAPAGVF
jgi:hypothetical protein